MARVGGGQNLGRSLRPTIRFTPETVSMLDKIVKEIDKKENPDASRGDALERIIHKEFESLGLSLD